MLRDERILFEKELKISQAKDDLSKILEMKLNVSKRSKSRKRRSLHDNCDVCTDREGSIKKDGDRVVSRSRSAGHTCTNNRNTAQSSTYTGVINVPIVHEVDDKEGEDEEKNPIEDNEKNIPCTHVEIGTKNVRDNPYLTSDDVLQDITVRRKYLKKSKLEKKMKEKMTRDMKREKDRDTGEGKRMNNDLSIQSAIDQRFDLGEQYFLYFSTIVQFFYFNLHHGCFFIFILLNT